MAPLALEALQQAGFATDHLGSKSWSVFATADAPQMDMVITLDPALDGRTRYLGPGDPVFAHWTVVDPEEPIDALEASRRLYRWTLLQIEACLVLLLGLDLEGPGDPGLQEGLDHTSQFARSLAPMVA